MLPMNRCSTHRLVQRIDIEIEFQHLRIQCSDYLFLHTQEKVVTG
jgi:hypothetical protein